MNKPSTAVVLPCSTEEFGKFISGLLGKPQTISSTLRGPYEISLRTVQDIHTLLTQRVGQQNEGTLSQFTAKLVFDDDSSVLLNSFEEFSTYREVRPVAVLALHISWTFLVRFNDRAHPEKQQIDLSFLAGLSAPVMDQDVPVVMLHGSESGFIVFRIAHTARTWGADIDALMRAHLKGIVEEVSPFKKWLSTHEATMALLTFSTVFLASIVATVVSTVSFVSEQREQLAQFAVDASAGVSAEQFYFVTEIVASGLWERFLLFSSIFLLLAFVTAILISVWIASTADNLPPSFILLTDESSKRKKRILARKRTKWWSFIGGLVTAILAGVGANILYAIWFADIVR